MSENKKLVPKRRFKEFENTDVWKQSELGEVLSGMYNGQTPSRFSAENWGGKINWLTSGELNQGVVMKTIEKITPIGQKDANLRVVPEGTFIMAITGLEAAGTRGSCARLGIPTTLNQSCMALFPKENLLDSGFLFQWYKKIGESYGLKYTQGTKQQSYNAELVKILPIILPNVAEQKEISNFLDNLDQTIAFQQRKLEKMKSMKSAYLSEMFPAEGERKPKRRFPGFTDDWEQRELGEIVNWSKGDKLSKEKLNESGNGEPVIHYANLYKFSPVIYDVINWSTSNEGRLIPDNSLLFPMSDVTPVGLARTSTITKSGVKAGGDTLIGTVDDFYSAQFVSYFINANSNKILPLVTGTTVRHISANSLSKLEILLPDIKEQQKISDFLNSIQETIAFQQKKLEKLQNIKKAYLNEMFI
ncbi:restriction endonuclease subunit S [Lactococcus lactis]|uniref:restriction endonuclease subunit S n=1 Tax=Lactococcus lactis TaxID=1358 RepID=UPI001F15F33E|nr:restriction endonuclease subunit S [Lactococcus lactis]MCG1001214.1 restriction endonuclease subunit S [Lactococcus lactis]